jgi:oxygen-independent coproporphyrinogen III oxidase
MNDLVNKYNVPAPRYTSYPTVPFWDQTPSQEQWNEMVKASFITTNQKDGISLYIHLPFCESLCTYCACNTRITVNHKVELPYIEAVLAEWRLYLDLFDMKPKIKELHLGGGTPTFFSPENLEKLIKGILTGATKCYDAAFSFEGHPANTSEAHLSTLFDLGFRRVSFGIQDFDPKVQEAIHRYQSFEEVQAITHLARKIGYTSINYDLVYGLPFQTVISIKDTIEKVIQLRPDRIAFYSYAHVPWIKPGQRKYTEFDLPAGQEKLQICEFGKKMFIDAGYKYIGMDHFALPEDSLYRSFERGELHRNFMGYTDKYTELMIGLGASSISDTWNSFSQNIKAVEPYQDAVKSGCFPISKGHILTEEDIVIRCHILNIMCKGQTSWRDAGFESLLLALKRCEDLIADGLIEISDNTLTVKPAGMQYLRNIGMCFDTYLNKTKTENKFSLAV